MDELTADIFDVYRGTTHDGPGLRDTVFFRGCPLRCLWCHNPEGIDTLPRVWWESGACIGCGSCAAACPHDAVEAGADGLRLFPDRCERCGACVRACPTGAIRFISRRWTLPELMAKVCRDEDYFRSFGGGVTASGGEAALQSDFVFAFFQQLQARGIHTALDTSGQAPYPVLRRLLTRTDCVLYDVKHIDPRCHRALTGADNRLILGNLHQLAADISGGLSCRLWIRTPLIPGATATEENLAGIGRLLTGELGAAVTRWELCAYNNACQSKYSRLGLDWPFAAEPLLMRAQVEKLRRAALASGFPPDRLVVTGIFADNNESEGAHE